jgi:hypothetical protein
MSGSRVRWSLLVALLTVFAGTTTTTSAAVKTVTPSRKHVSRAVALLDEWAACERGHGNRGQTDPTIDSHWVIQITYAPSALTAGHGAHLIPTGGPETATGTCGTYLASAQQALRAAHPVRDPKGPTQSTYLRYVTCMRANGVPNYPYPERDDPSKTDFVGTGVDPTSPAVEKVNDLCGKKLGLPAWWVYGWGQPGDVSVSTARAPTTAPACLFKKDDACRTKAVSGL